MRLSGYAYRDPARVTPARLAELEARDARAALAARPVTSPAPAARDARLAEFTALRESGTLMRDIPAVMGISRRTARAYETARQQPGGTA